MPKKLSLFEQVLKRDDEIKAMFGDPAARLRLAQRAHAEALEQQTELLHRPKVAASRASPAVQSSKPRNASFAKIQADYASWSQSNQEEPTRQKADEWAKGLGYSTAVVRKLHSKFGSRKRGRPKASKPRRK